MNYKQTPVDPVKNTDSYIVQPLFDSLFNIRCNGIQNRKHRKKDIILNRWIVITYY